MRLAVVSEDIPQMSTLHNPLHKKFPIDRKTESLPLSYCRQRVVLWSTAQKPKLWSCIETE